MGIGVVGATLLGGEFSGGLFSRDLQRRQQEESIKLNLESEEAAESNRSLMRTQRLNSILASQAARAGASGFSAASPSLFAISANSINKFAQDENADAINLSFDKINAAHQERNAFNQELFGDLGSVISLGQTFYEGHYSTGGQKFNEQFNPTDGGEAL